jgi:hypothetical protein
MVCECKWNDSVVGLPEGADEEEGKSYEDSSFVIQFHILYILRLEFTAEAAERIGGNALFLF